MIRLVTGREYAKLFTDIYNSANTLFPESERADAGEEIFYRQLSEDCNFLYVIEGEACGFMSWHRCEGRYEVTSLYVKRQCQGRKAGSELLKYFEEHIMEDACILVKVLKNAPWALNFYKKHGYEILREGACDHVIGRNIKEKPWEKILYKDWIMQKAK